MFDVRVFTFAEFDEFIFKFWYGFNRDDIKVSFGGNPDNHHLAGNFNRDILSLFEQFHHFFTAGQLPARDGEMLATGKLGAEVSEEQGYACARQCALNALAAVAAEVGGLSAVKRVVKAVVFVASTPDFTAQPKVANGASELLGEVFGDAGRHARSAVGVASLPLDVPVEVELVVEV